VQRCGARKACGKPPGSGENVNAGHSGNSCEVKKARSTRIHVIGVGILRWTRLRNGSKVEVVFGGGRIPRARVFGAGSERRMKGARGSGDPTWMEAKPAPPGAISFPKTDGVCARGRFSGGWRRKDCARCILTGQSVVRKG